MVRLTNPVGAKQTRQGRKYLGYPSVTTVIGIVNKPGLSWASAKETAIFAVLHPDQIAGLSEEAAIDRLYRHHQGVWDAKAQKGTDVHDLARRWAGGEDIDVVAEHAPFIDALEQFYLDHDPRWVHVERTVLNENEAMGYGGTFDAIADLTSDGRRWLLDIKTGSAVYPETAMQLAAYRFAPFIVTFSPDGKKVIDRTPMPPVDACGVVHLTEDGTYRLVPVEAGEREMDAFLHARRLWEWSTKTAKTVVGEPISTDKAVVL